MSDSTQILDLNQVARVLALSESFTDKWIPLNTMQSHMDNVDPNVLESWAVKLRDLKRRNPTFDAVVASSSHYPHNLKNIPNRPSLIFTEGSLRREDDRAVAIVGSRDANLNAIEMAEEIAHDLAARGFTIVSGLARGIDAAAHRGAIKANGRTVAVMGTGIGRTYPTENAALAKSICRRGALVSQFPPMYGPTKTTFPARNAVIAGLALGSIVVAAKQQSGTQIEINYSLALGRPVFLWASILQNEVWAQDLASKWNNDLVSFVDSVDEIEGRLNGTPS
jgi:DNA processing protein